MSLLDLLRPAPPIRTPDPYRHVLLLDVDGVLVQPPGWFGARLVREHGDVARRFLAGPFRSASTGQSDLLDHLPAFLAETGQEVTPEAFLREWLESENSPVLPMLAAVRELRARGWRVHLATNQEAHRTRHLLHEVGLGALVDGHFASCTVGHRKPDPAYFREVARRLGVEAAHIVFWDDSAANVRAAGWTALRFRTARDFRRRMGLPPASTPAR